MASHGFLSLNIGHNLAKGFIVKLNVLAKTFCSIGGASVLSTVFNQNVMKIIFVSMGLLLSLASTSCTPDNFASTEKEQIETLATDPPSEEPGEDVNPNED